MRLSRLLLVSLLTGCSLDDGVDPLDAVSVEDQVWAASLGVDLSVMTKLPSGVYVLDQTVGTGPTVTGAPIIRFYYSGYLANGHRFDTNVGATVPAAYPPTP
jgi:hypothetical protein